MKCFNENGFSLFSSHFKPIANSHSNWTRWVSNGLTFRRRDNTIRYDNKSLINSTVNTWSHFQAIFHGYNLLNISPKEAINNVAINKVYLMYK